MFKAASGAVYRRVKVAAALPPVSFALRLFDAGAGAVDLTAQSQGSGAATFTRATTAWTKLSTGLWASVASGTARSSYLGANTTVGAYGGYLAEVTRTNQCLQSRNLTATWTLLNTTAAKDQVGIDGVVNSASSLTATLGGGTALQTVTEAATLSAFSIFIKRITGVGTVTIQQGASTLEVSGSLNSLTYTRVEIDATVLNPIIGIALGTNGDKIAVDMSQFENGGFALSPIPTTTVAVTRNADVLTYPSAGNISSIVGTVYTEWTAGVNAGTGAVCIGDSAGSSYPLYINGASHQSIYDGTNIVSVVAISILPTTSVQKGAGTWGGSTLTVVANGGTVASGTFSGTMVITNIQIGAAASSSQLSGTIRNVRIFRTQLSAAQLQAMTT